MDYNYIYCMLIGVCVGSLFGFLIGNHVAGKEYNAAKDSTNDEKAVLRDEVSEYKHKYEALVEKYSSKSGADILMENAHNNRGKSVEPETVVEESPVSEDKSEDIVQITEEEYISDDETEEVPNCTLTYYQSDGVLSDDHDEKINNLEKYLGKDILEDIDTTDEDTIYIRNGRLGRNIELIVEHELGYYSDVLGLG